MRISALRELELRQVDAKRGRARRYHVSKCRSLFGELSILVTWGRIGARPRMRLETFRSKATQSARWRELLARRRAHGYEVVERLDTQPGRAGMR